VMAQNGTNPPPPNRNYLTRNPTNLEPGRTRSESRACNIESGDKLKQYRRMLEETSDLLALTREREEQKKEILATGKIIFQARHKLREVKLKRSSELQTENTKEGWMSGKRGDGKNGEDGEV
jgi:hypothetical protein